LEKHSPPPHLSTQRNQTRMVQNAFTIKPSGKLGQDLERQALHTRLRINGKHKAGMTKEEAITSFNKSHIDLGNSPEKPGLKLAKI